MGRVGYGPSLYGPSWLWAEFVMGRVCYGPRCPVTVIGSNKMPKTDIQQVHFNKIVTIFTHFSIYKLHLNHGYSICSCTLSKISLK